VVRQETSKKKEASIKNLETQIGPVVTMDGENILWSIWWQNL